MSSPLSSDKNFPYKTISLSLTFRLLNLYRISGKSIMKINVSLSTL